MNRSNQNFEYVKYESGEWQLEASEVIVEQPVTLTVNGEPWLDLLCTPIDLEAMAVGFLFNEGVIDRREEILDVRVCPTADNVDVWLKHSVEKPEKWSRTSGCTGGLTSVSERTNGGRQNAPEVTQGEITLDPDQVRRLVGELFEVQDLYKKSGGVHTSALSDGNAILAVAEDIGRHNTLDKLAGHCLLEAISPRPWVLLTTGRISSEMLQKADRIGAQVVISRTSPSSLSIEMAEQRGITLIGYAHRNRFKVYTHNHRLSRAVAVTTDVSES